jgi:uncharacterized protein YjbJ (UPF0337 family)
MFFIIEYKLIYMLNKHKTEKSSKGSFIGLLTEDKTMNRDEFEGKWKQFKGKIRERWGKLTNDDLEVIDGEYDQFIGQLQQKYGYSREKAEQELQAWKFEQKNEQNRGWEKKSGGKDSNLGNNRDRNEGGQNTQRNPEDRQLRNEQSKHVKGNFESPKDTKQDKNKFDDRKDKKRKAG